MGAAETLVPVLRAIAARCLDMAPEALDPDAPLARYGLDSLNAVELCVAITEATGMAMTEDALLDAPSIGALALHLQAPGAAHAEHDPAAARLLAMRADAQLPWEIDPLGAAPVPRAGVLLTGATGFLGAHLLAALLARGVPQVVCPVRAGGDAEALARVRATLARYGVAVAGLEDKVQAIAADITRPDLGLGAHGYAALAERVGAIYHCAAMVNWTLPYDALRVANVHATENLLRFACRGVRKAVHYVSSVAACYSTCNHGPVDETQAAPDPAGIHLGYGQSKWVAERLVEAAAARGLPATLYRPSLIAGAAGSGIGNDDDFLARMLRGCIALGYAPELDWRLDACPVDAVAAAIAALGQDASRPMRIVHLRNPRHARWTEAVLWMNLRGHRVRLEPFEAWIARVERCTRAQDHPLHPLRGFLLHRPPGEGGRTLPQIYADAGSARLDAAHSDAALARFGIACPRLGAGLLERYFDVWSARGVLPRSSGSARPRAPAGSAARHDAIEQALRTHYGDPALRVIAAKRADLGAEHSILGELASWRVGSDLALHGLVLELQRGDGRLVQLDLVVKPRPEDGVVLGVMQEVAAQCDPALGAAFAAHADGSEFAGGTAREIAIYTGAHGALASHMPACFGLLHAGGMRALLLEHIRDAALIDSVNEIAAWTSGHIEAALVGIAEVHAQWLGREAEVTALLGRHGTPAPAGAAAAHAWRHALAQHARPWFERWIGEDGAREQRRLVERALMPTERAVHPRTLIHNDFNPRNLALRHSPHGLALCAFDWELAAFGLPQRDVVELLCFVLMPDAAGDSIEHYLRVHRRALEQAAGVGFEPEAWDTGTRQALVQFGVERLPAYLIAHRFRPLPFLERVTRTWYRLFRRYAPAPVARKAR